jgi:hypothetical protein
MIASLAALTAAAGMASEPGISEPQQQIVFSPPSIQLWFPRSLKRGGLKRLVVKTGHARNPSD